jgi:NAD(P)-dependent dehydrogenase (short-subunit alcohol dehydrogenase family)
LGLQFYVSGFGPCSASKFALEGLTEVLAQEIASFGLKTMVIEPGELRTAFVDTSLRHMPRIAAYDALQEEDATLPRA